MAACVVDRLEVIQVDEQEPAIKSVAIGCSQCMGDFFLQLATVRELSKRIKINQTGYLSLSFFISGEVKKTANIMGG